jgi:hypothetical protein
VRWRIDGFGAARLSLKLKLKFIFKIGSGREFQFWVVGGAGEGPQVRYFRRFIGLALNHFLPGLMLVALPRLKPSNSQ